MVVEATKKSELYRKHKKMLPLASLQRFVLLAVVSAYPFVS